MKTKHIIIALLALCLLFSCEVPNEKNPIEQNTELISYYLDNFDLAKIIADENTRYSVEVQKTNVTNGSESKDVANALKLHFDLSNYVLNAEDELTISGNFDVVLKGTYAKSLLASNIYNYADKNSTLKIRLYSYTLISDGAFTFSDKVNGTHSVIFPKNFEGDISGVYKVNNLNFVEESLSEVTDFKLPADCDDFKIGDMNIEYSSLTLDEDFMSPFDPSYYAFADYFMWPAHNRMNGDLKNLLSKNEAASSARKGTIAWTDNAKKYEYDKEKCTLTLYLTTNDYNFDGKANIRRAFGKGKLVFDGTVEGTVFRANKCTFISDGNIELKNLSENVTVSFDSIVVNLSSTLDFNVTDENNISITSEDSAIKWNFSTNTSDYKGIKLNGIEIAISDFLKAAMSVQGLINKS